MNREGRALCIAENQIRPQPQRISVVFSALLPNVLIRANSRYSRYSRHSERQAKSA